MMNNIIKLVFLSVLLSLFTGCATTGVSHKKDQPEVNLNKINQELPEQQLLDVWIELFDSGELPADEDDALGLSQDIREAEAHYIPIHLRGVIEKTGYWGAVRVVPHNSEGAEVLVQGLILLSNETELELEISVEDASGRIWFKKTYKDEVDLDIYTNISEDVEPFQSIYRLIANDLADFYNELSAQERMAIRQFAMIRFAADMAPNAFASHLQRDDEGLYQLNRLPAENDPTFQRVQRVRERDYLLVDVLNGHFDNYYLEMDEPYMQWRKARSYETAAIYKNEQEANTRMLLGAAAIVGAIAIELFGDVRTQQATGSLRNIMVLGGALAVKQGFDIRSQSAIHKAAIEELGISFSDEAQPQVVEVDNEVYELTGSAEVQYQQWRELIQKIYASDTGLDTVSISSDN